MNCRLFDVSEVKLLPGQRSYSCCHTSETLEVETFVDAFESEINYIYIKVTGNSLEVIKLYHFFSSKLFKTLVTSIPANQSIGYYSERDVIWQVTSAC